MKITQFSMAQEILAELGLRIKQERIRQNLMQEELADRAGVSVHTVSNLERGADISLSTLLRVLRVLGFLDNVDLLIPEAGVSLAEIVDRGQMKTRASRKKNSESGGWKWGDEP